MSSSTVCGNCGLAVSSVTGYCRRTKACARLREQARLTLLKATFEGTEKVRQQKAASYAGAGGAKTREQLRSRRRYWQGRVDAHKVASGCAECGFESQRANYFDLDHVDKHTKRFSVSSLCARLTPGKPEHERLFVEELQKCQVLCVACHRDKSAREQSVFSEIKVVR
jgi:hypothetical protein